MVRPLNPDEWHGSELERAAGWREPRFNRRKVDQNVPQWEERRVAAVHDRVPDPLREAAKRLADEAARAITEPRRFHEDEDGRQHALGVAVATLRAALGEEPHGQ